MLCGSTTSCCGVEHLDMSRCCGLDYIIRFAVQFVVQEFVQQIECSLSLSLSLSYSAAWHEDVAASTSRRHAGLSIARRLAVARPKLSGRRSSSTVLSQVCLGLPVLRRHSLGGPRMQARRAREWSWPVSARHRWPKKDKRQQIEVMEFRLWHRHWNLLHQPRWRVRL